MLTVLLLAAIVAVSPADKREAARLAHRSIIEYNAGDFEPALADAKKAYELYPLPALLYDLGQCHRALHHWEQAAFFFRGYLREEARARNRAMVVALIAEMDANRRKEEAEADRARAAPAIAVIPVAPVAAPAAPPVVAPAAVRRRPPAPAKPRPVPAAAISTAPARARRSVAPWVVAGGGVLATIAGGVLWGLASSYRGGYGGAGRVPPGVTYGALQQSNTFALAGDVLVPAGAALLVGGALWAGLASPPAGGR